MLKSSEKNAASNPLMEFVEKLTTENYKTVDEMCSRAGTHAEKVKSLENEGAITNYTVFCTDIIGETKQFIKERYDRFVPYIHTLLQKVETNHDCTNCAGGCKLNHDMHLLELMSTNERMRNVVSRLQMAALPLYSDAMYPDAYRLLRGHMSLIETGLSELVFLENSYLIPKVREAQKTINVGNK